MSCSTTLPALHYSSERLSVSRELLQFGEVPVADPFPRASKRLMMEYDAIIPVLPNRDMLVDIGRSPEGDCVFSGYRRLEDGSKGPAELCQAVRNEGDVIVAVNGVSTQGKTYHEVLEILRESCDMRYSMIRFQDCSERYGHRAPESLSSKTGLPYELFPANVQKEALEENVARLQSRFQTKHAQFQQSQECIHRLDEELQRRHGQIRVLEKSVAELQADLFQKHLKLQDLEQKVAQLEAEVSIRDNKIEAMRSKQSTELHQLESRIAELEKNTSQSFSEGTMDSKPLPSPDMLKAAARVLHSFHALPVPPFVEEEACTHTSHNNDILEKGRVSHIPGLSNKESDCDAGECTAVTPLPSFGVDDHSLGLCDEGCGDVDMQRCTSKKSCLKQAHWLKVGFSESQNKAATTTSVENSETMPMKTSASTGLENLPPRASSKVTNSQKTSKVSGNELQYSTKKKQVFGHRKRKSRGSTEKVESTQDVSAPLANDQRGSKKARIMTRGSKKSEIMSNPLDRDKNHPEAAREHPHTIKETNHELPLETASGTMVESSLEETHMIADKTGGNGGDFECGKSTNEFEVLSIDKDNTSVSENFSENGNAANSKTKGTLMTQKNRFKSPPSHHGATSSVFTDAHETCSNGGVDNESAILSISDPADETSLNKALNEMEPKNVLGNKVPHGSRKQASVNLFYSFNKEKEAQVEKACDEMNADCCKTFELEPGKSKQESPGENVPCVTVKKNSGAHGTKNVHIEKGSSAMLFNDSTDESEEEMRPGRTTTVALRLQHVTSVEGNLGDSNRNDSSRLYRCYGTQKMKMAKQMHETFNDESSDCEVLDDISIQQMGTKTCASKESKSSLIPDHYAAGTAVKKFFDGHGWFYGKIVRIEDDRYKIEYEDGDTEDYLFTEKSELDKIVVKRETRKIVHKITSDVNFTFTNDFKKRIRKRKS